MEGTPEIARGGPDGRPGPTDDERVDEMEEESFPASDAPSSWAGEDPMDRPEE